ncbi:polyketide cyclase [Mycolicibacterium cyprinidarum]|uniref:Polyketide cyclase n=1 Tax=Mycolicibacterium cyprinidarum TaxID=2860311 RepID=A0ABQ4V6D7_9MYCO|nr:polyketide cyclase [Mycolicibacterium sp. NGTWS1803]GJF11131.1 polyketide cyclase [Mycolicibacterium sp. NGTWSNA01]GJF13827.1 polyketide cyclase [Mycolicibacterium sp. NGTWS0302]
MLHVMTRWFALESADAGFFESAPHVFRYERHFDAPVEQVWESLQSDESMAAWGDALGSLAWTSSRPFGISTTRDVGLGPTKVRERFFRWDEGSGYSFYIYEANLPGFRRFAEDYRVEPDGNGTRFTWLVAIEPVGVLRLPFKALAPIAKSSFGRMADEGQKYFATR